MINVSFFNSARLPACIKPDGGPRIPLAEAVENYRRRIDQLLLDHGAVVLRGFEIDTHQRFETAVRTFSGKTPLNYAGGVSPRKSLNNAGVYTSTEYPPSWTIPLHNELSYSARFPDHIYFCCLTEAASGGETTLGDSRRILDRVGGKIADMFRKRAVCYIRTLDGEAGSGYAWQDAFETNDPEIVEQICERFDTSYEWAGKTLILKEIRPATTTHPTTGEEVWFNQADGFHISNATGCGCRSLSGNVPRLQALLGDESPICLLLLDRVRAAIEAQTVAHKWQRGDLLILDNRLAAHGRMPFEGERKVAVAMT